LRIAVSASGPSLDADVDPRFGRCQYFIIVDPDTLEFEAVENSSQGASGGAGIAAAQSVVGRDVEAVLTGNCGPNAFQVLQAADIALITGVSGSVRDAVSKYKAGDLRSASQPTVEAHFGMVGGPGPGSPAGPPTPMGPGMRPGMGVPPPDLAHELESLKAQTQMLSQQLSDVLRRLDDLEKK